MKVFGIILILLVCSAPIYAQSSLLECAQSHQEVEYEPFTLTLPALNSAEEYVYLGIEDRTDGEVAFTDLADTIIIFEVFSMYCPHCQKDAPTVNELYTLIEEEGLNEKIKIIGIGNKNSFFEVKIFRDKYNVPFPIIPDEYRKISKVLIKKQVGTPFFLAVYVDDEGTGHAFYSKTASVGDPKLFLTEIKARLQLKEEKDV